MRNAIRKRALFALLAVLAVPAFGQTDITKFANALESSSEVLERALISTSALGLNWSDAYIGQIVGVPPHFGVGVSLGFTGVSLEKLEPVFEELGMSISDMELPVNFLPIPTMAGELRVGGFYLPFDIGIKALPLPQMHFGDFSVKYTMVGGDFRYNILKDRGVFPAVSVGAGLTWTSLDLGAKLGTDTNIDLAPLSSYGVGGAITVGAPNVDFAVRNTTLDLKVQASKKFFIVTPYLGLGLSYGWSSLDFEGKTNITSAATGTGNWQQAIEDATGIKIPNAGNTTMSREYKYNGFGFRTYGGLSFNIAVIKIDLTGLYDIVNANWGASLGLRFQL